MAFAICFARPQEKGHSFLMLQSITIEPDPREWSNLVARHAAGARTPTSSRPAAEAMSASDDTAASANTLADTSADASSSAAMETGRSSTAPPGASPGPDAVIFGRPRSEWIELTRAELFGRAWADLCLLADPHSAKPRAETASDAPSRLPATMQVPSPIIATGHQASFWHPGILAKYIALDAFAAARVLSHLEDTAPDTAPSSDKSTGLPTLGIRLELVVDHDGNDPLSITTPAFDDDAGRLTTRTTRLARPADGDPAGWSSLPTSELPVGLRPPAIALPPDDDENEALHRLPDAIASGLAAMRRGMYEARAALAAALDDNDDDDEVDSGTGGTTSEAGSGRAASLADQISLATARLRERSLGSSAARFIGSDSELDDGG
ncbi:MAG: hypothetical protein ACOC0P_02000, partial [Planctomycetota bacterium]